jgi:hypothetical protein
MTVTQTAPAAPANNDEIVQFTMNKDEWITDPDQLVGLPDYYYEIMIKDRFNNLRHGVGRMAPSTNVIMNPSITSSRQYRAQMLPSKNAGNAKYTNWSYEYLSYKRLYTTDSIVAVRRLNNEQAAAVQSQVALPAIKSHSTR